MKIQPISADMLIKLGLGVAVLGAIGLALWKIKSAVPAVVEAINPADPNNLINRGVGAVGGAIVSDPTGPGKNADGSWSLGGWLYDVTHPEEVAAIKALSEPVPSPDPYDFIFYRK